MLLFSGKAWVFRYIFKFVFPFFYGHITVQRNRLTLSDEDMSEYKTFESLIELDENFANSRIMLCCFHAIWMPFKANIQGKLPKKGSNLTKAGYDYGGVVLNFFMRMCTYVETSEEFDRCCSDLYLFLKDSRTVAALSGECISAIKEMGESASLGSLDQAFKDSDMVKEILLFIFW